MNELCLWCDCCAHQPPSYFQKHEDESESWLHRQVGHNTLFFLAVNKYIENQSLIAACALKLFFATHKQSRFILWLRRTRRRSSPKMDTSFSSPERSLRAAEGSFFTFQCLPPWWAIPGNLSVAINSWLPPCTKLCSTFVVTCSLTRAQTSCSRWPPGTGMSPRSWPTATGGTSCETFSCTLPETAEPSCLWFWRCHSDVLQILFKHRGRPQAPTFVQVEDLLQLKVPSSFAVTKVAVYSPCTARTRFRHSTAAACPASSTAATWTFPSATTCSTSCSTAKVSVDQSLPHLAEAPVLGSNGIRLTVVLSFNIKIKIIIISCIIGNCAWLWFQYTQIIHDYNYNCIWPIFTKHGGLYVILCYCCFSMVLSCTKLGTSTFLFCSAPLTFDIIVMLSSLEL